MEGAIPTPSKDKLPLNKKNNFICLRQYYNIDSSLTFSTKIAEALSFVYL